MPIEGFHLTPGDATFLAILDEAFALYATRADYGTRIDQLANLRSSEKFGIPAWIGATIRGNDKMVRLANAARGKELVNESVDETLLEAGLHFVLCMSLWREYAGINQAFPPDIFAELADLHIAKGADYGFGEDQLANLRASADFGVEPWVGVLIRAEDKLERLRSACRGIMTDAGKIENAFLDASTYFFLALRLYRELPSELA